MLTEIRVPGELNGIDDKQIRRERIDKHNSFVQSGYVREIDLIFKLVGELGDLPASHIIRSGLSIDDLLYFGSLPPDDYEVKKDDAREYFLEEYKNTR